MDRERDKPDRAASTANVRLDDGPRASVSDRNDIVATADNPRHATTIFPPDHQSEVDLAAEKSARGRALAGNGQASPAPIAPGTMVGHHKLERELGRGGMGAVYLARDTRLGRRVAIKFLLDNEPSRAQRFLAEARATARCKHDNIIDIYEVGEAHGHAYMVLEYIEGMTLSTWIARRWAGDGLDDTNPIMGTSAPAPVDTRITPNLAAEMMIPVVDALVHAHERGLVHRDLKPANIMLTENDAIRVLDFGIAKVLTDQLVSFTNHGARQDQWDVVKTMEGAIVGTMPYMSPEQWAGRDLDGRSDLWAVGIILWELVTGCHPLGLLSLDSLKNVAELDIPMPLMSERYPHLCPLAGIVDRCLRKPRDERIPSAQALLEELRRLAKSDVMPSSAEPAQLPPSGAQGDNQYDNQSDNQYDNQSDNQDDNQSDNQGDNQGDNQYDNQGDNQGDNQYDNQGDNQQTSSNRSLPTVGLDSADAFASAQLTGGLSPPSKPAPRRRWLIALAGSIAVAAMAVGWLLPSSDRAARDIAASATSTEQPRSGNQPAWSSAEPMPTAQTLLAVVGVGAAQSDHAPAAALCTHLQNHPHTAGLLPATQDARGLVWCRAGMGLAQAKHVSTGVATPVVAAVHDDGRMQVAVRGPRGSWLIDGLALFAGTDSARAQLAPVLYGLAQVQRGQTTSTTCVSHPVHSSTVDPLAVLRLYVDEHQSACRQQVPAVTPAGLLAVCRTGAPGDSEVCDLARLLYTELFPGADDAVNVLRTLLDERPEFIVLAGASLARTSCRLGRLATANAVLSDLVARLGAATEHACERLALIDVAACIAGHPEAAAQLDTATGWRADIDALDSQVVGDCAACGNPTYCGQKLGARGLMYSRQGHWDQAAADFAAAYAHAHNTEWALLRAEASLHLDRFDDARRRLQHLADQRALQDPIAYLQHALFSWLAARGSQRARGAQSSAVALQAQRLVDVYEHCCTEGACNLDPDDAPLRALVCTSPASCVYDVLAGPRTRASVATLRRLLDIGDTNSAAPSDAERAALLPGCAAANR